MPLQVRAFGLAVGLVWGVIILGVSLLVTIKGAGGEHLSRLGLLYPGYRVTYWGSVIGFVWSVIYGFLAGALLAWVYNRLLRAEKR
jgi:tetrahydromethanopterin S-methyltransferase subunit F